MCNHVQYNFCASAITYFGILNPVALKKLCAFNTGILSYLYRLLFLLFYYENSRLKFSTIDIVIYAWLFHFY